MANVCDNDGRLLEDDLRPLSEIADELTADVPDEEWERVPSGLVENLDHYLYGSPKVTANDNAD